MASSIMNNPQAGMATSMATMKDMCALPGMSQMCQDNTHVVISTCISLMFLSICAVLLRLVSRRVSTLSFWWDDATIILSLVRAELVFKMTLLLLTKTIVGLIHVFRAYARWYSSPRFLVVVNACSQARADAKNGVGRHFETVPGSSVVLLFKVSYLFASISHPLQSLTTTQRPPSPTESSTASVFPSSKYQSYSSTTASSVSAKASNTPATSFSP